MEGPGALQTDDGLTTTHVTMSMNNLVDANAALSDYTQAAALHMVLGLRKRVMGADHPDIAIHGHEQLMQRLCCAERLQAGCDASCERSWGFASV